MAVEERSMVERVAIHLCRTHQEVDFSKARAYARTAIEAMREPTEWMVNGAYAALEVYDFSQSDACTVREAHRAMIDAALST